jgi:hypothetical protein
MESVPSKLPTFKDGTPFYSYGSTNVFTDYTSKGEAFNKYRESAKRIYNIPTQLIGNHVLVNNIVMNDVEPYIANMNHTNAGVFKHGLNGMASSSMIPSYTYINKDTNINPFYNFPTGSKSGFLRPRLKTPVFVKDSKVNLEAIKNCFRPTYNNVQFSDVAHFEPITDGLYASPHSNGLAMPINYENPGSDMSYFANNNSRIGEYPNTETINFVQKVLYELNLKGFSSENEAIMVRDTLSARAYNMSTSMFIKSLDPYFIEGKYYLLPSFS